AHLPGALDGRGQELGAQALSDEAGQETEICQLDVVVALALELEVAGGAPRDVPDPRLELGAIEVREPLRMIPRQTAVPHPAIADGGVEEAVERGGRDLDADQAEPPRAARPRAQLGRAGHLEGGRR